VYIPPLGLASLGYFAQPDTIVGNEGGLFLLGFWIDEGCENKLTGKKLSVK